MDPGGDDGAEVFTGFFSLGPLGGLALGLLLGVSGGGGDSELPVEASDVPVDAAVEPAPTAEPPDAVDPDPLGA